MKAQQKRSPVIPGKESPVASKAEQLGLAKNATVDDALAGVFTSCFRHWTANEAVVLSGRDPEGVHEMRVALRRMRVAISDFQEIIPAAQVTWLKRETKWLVTSLGSARDWDVFLSELLAPIEAARLGDRRLVELRAAAETEKVKGYTQAQSALRSSRYSALVARMGRWLSAKAWREGRAAGLKAKDESAESLAGRLLAKRQKAVLKRGRDFTQLSGQERHQLRIAFKKLRYTADFFHSLYPEKHQKPYFRVLARMQDSLGRMNDVVVAEHLLERMASAHHSQRISDHLSAAAGIVTGWHAHSASGAEQEAEANWRDFCKCNAFW